jgi:CheY-like chemotaxis protein
LSQRLALTLDHLRQCEVTKRTTAELESAGRAKDAFLATLSHELRAPLNAIVGWANILASGEVESGKRAHAVDTIDRNARALASLIADLVDRNSTAPWQSQTGLSAARGNLLPELLSGVHALVVEDDPDSSELVETILRRFGADVTCVATVRAALGALAVRRPDVLVSDIGLPDDDGLTLIRRVREMQELAALPAIALSAYASRRDISQALAAGFQAYIAKPIEPDQLGKIIADVVNG